MTDHHEPVYIGFWIRFAAAFIDGIVTSIPTTIISLIFSGMMMMPMATESAALGFLPNLLNIAVMWLYQALMESSKTQATLGKMALGIKVTDLEGNRISFARATGRSFAKYISAIILFIGYIMAAFMPKKQALHDLIAGTVVVKK